MYGAIMGDIVGSRFEFDRGNKSKDFKLFTKGTEFPLQSVYTDDTVMSIAVANALLAAGPEAGEEDIKSKLIHAMKYWGRKYPNAGYGGNFRVWLFTDDENPYGSYGNGSAMRVSAVGWLYDTIERTREVARWTAEVTHNHPEGIKGAEATASIIYLARSGFTKEYIRDYVVKEFGYDLSRTCDEIRPYYHHVESCQETVPEAITAFLEGEHYTDVVRTAVSLGGDCDTLTDIAAAMAEAYYGIPKKLIPEIEDRLDEDLKKVLWDFNAARQTVVAVKRDWAAEAMPKERDTFTLERKFTDEEMKNLRRGNVLKEMENKWFFYMRHNKLFAHRSWTGFLIYVIEFNPTTNIHKVTVNRQEDQYNSVSIEEDRDHLDTLLNWWVQPQYDYYNEWLAETYDSLVKSGQIQPPHEVIEEKIENEMIEDLSYENIKAFMFAEGGAMGCPGEVRIFSLEGDKVYLRRNNFAYGDFDMDRFVEHFKPMKTLHYEMFGNLVHIEDGWKFIDLGAGNSLLMTDEVYNAFKDGINDKRPSEIYTVFEEAILEIMCSM